MAYAKPPLCMSRCSGELANYLCANHSEEETKVAVATPRVPIDNDPHQPHRLNHEPGTYVKQRASHLQEGMCFIILLCNLCILRS